MIQFDTDRLREILDTLSRNKSSDPRGSDTNGLQNYDALYADVLLWTKNGWVDYMMPQLYWELEHKAASTQVLAAWWNANANGRHMYFGQSIKTTMDKADTAPTGNPTQLDHKIRLSRSLQNVQGNCWWPGYEIVQTEFRCLFCEPFETVDVFCGADGHRESVRVSSPSELQ